MGEDGSLEYMEKHPELPLKGLNGSPITRGDAILTFLMFVEISPLIKVYSSIIFALHTKHLLYFNDILFTCISCQQDRDIQKVTDNCL